MTGDELGVWGYLGALAALATAATVAAVGVGLAVWRRVRG